MTALEELHLWDPQPLWHPELQGSAVNSPLTHPPCPPTALQPQEQQN